MIARSTRLARLVTGLATGFALVALVGCGNDADTTKKAPAGGGSATAVADAPQAPDVERTAEPRPWEHETSDIPVDPRIQFGHFDNGLRYAWASNPEPKERCYVRLHVNVGSLAEEDNEVGMAHFLEHMGFNGTENFAAGTLIEWFQEQGMAFGADTNAHTSFGETVYKLDLPENDAETLREGLQVLRDFADGMLIEEDEVQAEKGVIDGEQRERDSAGFRVLQKTLDIVFEGTRIGKRLPIGTKEVRDQFTAASVRAFYERWYRPENMTLVIVGDLGDLDPVELMREAFADMPVPEAPLVPEPGPGTASKFDHVFAIYEKEIPALQMSFDKMKAWEKEPVTVAEWIEDLPINYARRMLNLRFREMAKEESAPFMSASASAGEIFDVFVSEGVNVQCMPEKWKEALAAAEQEHRRALEHGFHQTELDEIRADALRGLDEAVAREATASSQMLLRRILSAAENPTVATTAETRRAVLKPAIEALTVESCHEAFVAGWAEGELSISMTGNLDLGETAAEQLRAVYEASKKVAVDKEEVADTDAFAYGSDPAKAGKVAERKHVDDLDFDMVKFENGVALNVKRTDFRKNTISMNVEFGEGRLTLEPKDMLTLGMVGPAVVNGGGLDAHSNDDLRRLTAGKQIGFGFAVTPDRFSLGGGTTAEDLLLQCEMAAAQLIAPGWREDGLVQLRRQVPMMYQQMAMSHQGPAMTAFFPALYDDDPRQGMPDEDLLMEMGVDEVAAWMKPVFADAPIELTLVGDLDIEETIKIVARTFGALPKRRAWNRHEDRRNMPAPKSGVRQDHAIPTQIPKSLVLIAFPTTDGIDMLQRRKLGMLNTVVSDRLRLEVREKLGAAYSPGSGNRMSTVHKGDGMLMMQAMADPDKVETLVDACLGVADTLAKDGITDEELDRLREPILNRRRDSKRTNRYWMTVMSRAQSEPGHLDDIRAGDAFYEGVKAADIAPLAAEYLPKERASIMVVSPEPND